METYDLAELVIAQDSQTWNLVFSRAKLMIVSDYGTRLWYIDIDGMTDESLLKRFAESENIGVDMHTTTIGGRRLEGRGFFHPNPQHRAAAIRGDGQLEGYGQPGGIAP
ncbi:hypothetical protein [Cohnella cholangitidis]|uniref:Uncharacterized protein n=1 Tax=Cohnella cholangitidis TaxID=2598458 RepID=A0A7G5C2L5_9BACL|nr:hypothetical protein [Cohnella cholangitidis]QMV43449.1 hypothetical protein FPL14_21415 [Cohnella cholangitidis]